MKLKSFLFAWRGAWLLLREEPNGRVHAVMAWLALWGSWVGGLSAEAVGLVAAMIGVVLGFEALNAALERTIDLVHPTRHPLARDAKDLAAGGVLYVAMAALAVAVLLFWPRHERLLLALGTWRGLLLLPAVAVAFWPRPRRQGRELLQEGNRHGRSS